MKAINPKWKKEIFDKIRRIKDGEDGVVIKLTESHPVIKKWITEVLAEKGIPFVSKSLKCGVVMISTETDICPFCNRSGANGRT